ncbi:MAG: nucleotidyl transferase AbiEii/AbiGii toxin family protein [Chitinophagaceae bacterium]|nr:nucleotidyl transferase AbiEii/AbiGii toxin family protein [Chitinophagaceae bacterium]MCA6495165.1 nucleotidyl transferase AbiEii/AbiGii toxin family protein [Chitinophagaceae bacterium]
MLHTETVESSTFSLLTRLMLERNLGELSLVGGTALSLLYGHRKSDDLDLFVAGTVDNDKIARQLADIFKERVEIRTNKSNVGVFCFIDNVKVDIVAHPHPLLAPAQTIDDIRFFSIEDIIAMKVQALLGRAKKKDFWDIAELLNHFTVERFIVLHQKKYNTQNLLITIPQALTYFSEAEQDEDPVGLKKQSWEGVKKYISQKVSHYLN